MSKINGIILKSINGVIFVKKHKTFTLVALGIAIGVGVVAAIFGLVSWMLMSFMNRFSRIGEIFPSYPFFLLFISGVTLIVLHALMNASVYRPIPSKPLAISIIVVDAILLIAATGLNFYFLFWFGGDFFTILLTVTMVSLILSMIGAIFVLMVEPVPIPKISAVVKRLDRLEEELEHIKNLYESGKITTAEYNQREQAILNQKL